MAIDTEGGSFYYLDTAARDRRVTSEENDGTNSPTDITDYVFSPSEWQKVPRPSDISGNSPWPPLQAEHILTSRPSIWACFLCKAQGECCQPSCSLQTFRKQCISTDDVELRQTDCMGIGVFATARIPRGTWLGDYAGKISPVHLADPRYSWRLSKDHPRISRAPLCMMDARHFGNWTRFINHRCERNNVQAEETRVGDARIIVYLVNREVKKGEQLFVDYGETYFEGSGKQCCCGSGRCKAPSRVRTKIS